MVNKGQETIFIKLVRSGIGFSHQQKRQIRALGFSRLNEVVERPDTPQIRGLVNSIPHLVKIVKKPHAAAWVSTPEYVVGRPEPSSVEPFATSEESASASAVGQESPTAESASAGKDEREKVTRTGDEVADKSGPLDTTGAEPEGQNPV